MFARLPVMRLSIAMTRSPSASSRSVRCDPRKPAPPVTTETFCELEAIAEVSNSPVKAWRERSEIHGAALRSERLGRSVYHPNNEHVFTVNDAPPHPPFWMILGSWARHERILIANEPSSIVSRDMVDEKPE